MLYMRALHQRSFTTTEFDESTSSRRQQEYARVGAEIWRTKNYGETEYKLRSTGSKGECASSTLAAARLRARPRAWRCYVAGRGRFVGSRIEPTARPLRGGEGESKSRSRSCSMAELLSSCSKTFSDLWRFVRRSTPDARVVRMPSSARRSRGRKQFVGTTTEV